MAINNQDPNLAKMLNSSPPAIVRTVGKLSDDLFDIVQSLVYPIVKKEENDKKSNTYTGDTTSCNKDS